jgi:hypothetical protein
MKTFTKFAVAAVMTGAVALAAASPSEARGGRNTAAAIGFGAGALVGAAAASSYNNGYYYGEPGYAYGGGYAYDTGYAYEPVYEPAPVYYYNSRPYRGTRSGCGSSPASMNGGQPC